MTILVLRLNELEGMWKAKATQSKALSRYLLAISDKKFKIEYTSPQTEF
jgi:hypothetical protein